MIYKNILINLKNHLHYQGAEEDIAVITEALKVYEREKSMALKPCICGSDSTEIVVHKNTDRGFILGVRCRNCGNTAYGDYVGRKSAIRQWNYENG